MRDTPPPLPGLEQLLQFLEDLLIGVADELVHYRGGVGKSNEKGGGGTLEAGRGDLKGDAFFKLKSGIHFTRAADEVEASSR